jgi:hypothetical protein
VATWKCVAYLLSQIGEHHAMGRFFEDGIFYGHQPRPSSFNKNPQQSACRKTTKQNDLKRSGQVDWKHQ